MDNKPVLTALQRRWLQEIGIDARMLAHFTRGAFAAEESAPAPVAPVSTASIRAIVTRAADSSAMPVGIPAAAQGVPVPAAVPAGVQARATASGDMRHIAEVLREARPASPLPATSAPGSSPLPGDATLEAMGQYAEQCTACGLHAVRGRAVFGEGEEQQPRIMLVGEAPGEYDDSTGRPFQGRAGELLQAMLAAAGLQQAGSLYFTNVVKCRPLGNRSPEPDEIAACLPLLRRQIQVLQPACLVALGRVSASTLLGRNEEVEALRGTVHAYIDEEGRSIPVVATHHPASLLLHAHLKADAWRDLILLRELVSERRPAVPVS